MIGIVEIMALFGIVFVALPLVALGLFAGFAHRRGGLSKERASELSEVREAIQALREELRDARADIADIALSLRDAERRALTDDDTATRRRSDS